MITSSLLYKKELIALIIVLNIYFPLLFSLAFFLYFPMFSYILFSAHLLSYVILQETHNVLDSAFRNHIVSVRIQMITDFIILRIFDPARMRRVPKSNDRMKLLIFCQME